MNLEGLPENPKMVVSSEQIQKRVRDIARQISDDYKGKTLTCIGVLENGFMFMADLVRALDVPILCGFIKAHFREPQQGDSMEIYFSPEVDVKDHHVLLVEGVLQSGVTSEFLMRNILGRGAASVKLAVLLDRQSARRVMLQPDYFGFLIDDAFVFGYGLGAPHLGRNLPYIASGTPIATSVTAI